MPITLPNLDDRRFDDLVAEARALIPALAPEWTDHNLADPGITLIELFAYLSEILIYRLNRVTDDNTRAFLQLLNGPPPLPGAPPAPPGSPPAWQPSADLDADIRYTIKTLRTPDRAVTPADFELLARAASTNQQVARVSCVPRRNLDLADPGYTGPDDDKPGHVSVVVLPVAGVDSATLIPTVSDYLKARRLLTTRLHVVAPRTVKIGVQLTLWLDSDAVAKTVIDRATDALRTFLNPLTGGTDGQGWPFGRAVFLSEIYQLLDALPGVDYVEPSSDSKGPLTELVFAEDPGASLDPSKKRRLENAAGQLVGVRLWPDEVVDVAIAPLALTSGTGQRN